MIARRILIAALIALVISGIFTLLLSRKFGKTHAASSQLQYVAAARDIGVGEVIKLEDVHLTSWPSNHVLTGAFVKPEELVGRAALTQLAMGQPIVEHQVTAVGAGVGLSAKIPDGMRAISLKSDQVVGVAGFLLPGTHVDVLVTIRNPAATDAQTSTVLQDAEILAAGQKLQADPEGKATTVDVVTLLVNPQDAERVTLASAQGAVHFVLRNASDHGKVDAAPTQISALGFGPAERRSVVPAPAPRKSNEPEKAQHYIVQVTRGDKQSQETF